MEYDFISGILELIQNQIFQIMKDKVNKEKAIDEIIKIESDFFSIDISIKVHHCIENSELFLIYPSLSKRFYFGLV